MKTEEILEKLRAAINCHVDHNSKEPEEIFFGSESRAFESGKYYGRTKLANELALILDGN